MSKDPLDDVVDREELEHFERRNPAFRGALTQLMNRLREAFVRNASPVPQKPEAQQLVVFFLSHQAADDFLDIVLLAAHGHGLGALKLLRPLFERVVTVLYLMAHPESVQDFNDWADVDAWRIIEDIRRSDLRGELSLWIGSGHLANLEAAYRLAKQRFGDHRSWTDKNLETLANDVGLGRFYLLAARWPNAQLHATRLGVETRLTLSNDIFEFAHGPRPHEADYALRIAHDLIVYLLHKANEFFSWKVDTSDVAADSLRCWGGSRATDQRG